MNILVLTSAYKDESLGTRDTSTNIVNSFVSDWVKQGHRVLVIHNSHRYPRLIHALPRTIKKNLASKMGFAIHDYDVVSEKTYIDNGAKIVRLPIKKFVPHQSPKEGVISKQANKIIRVLENEKFIPDVITGHWASPQMELIAKLKQVYNCKTAIVLHGTGYIEDKGFNAYKYLPYIDNLGARSASQASQIKDILKLDKLPFVCNSGVPDSYLEKYKLNLQKFENISVWKFVYVGRLVAYKNIDATIKALSQLKGIDWEFNILGDGAARNELETLCSTLGCQDKVHFYGRVSRNEVMKVLSESHVFVMVSTNEIFGLVYLEAMAASCITIASQKGGVDGIIVDGENGFLCEEGNTTNLRRIIDKIISTSAVNVIDLVKNGYETTLNFTDSKVATIYLNNISKSATPPN